jgi:hypothetical protein
MVTYNLSHLIQSDDQKVVGPIQDDEALFLYALIKVMCLRRVLEVGGLSGYSAKNFVAAVGNAGIVYSVDIAKVPSVAPNHLTIQKDAGLLTAADIDHKPLDLVFFDCHVYFAQIDMFHRLWDALMITDATVLALHDTNLHPYQTVNWAYPVDGGWVHQPVERRMANDFHRLDYDVFVLDTKLPMHGPHLPYRQGLTILRRFKPLVV